MAKKNIFDYATKELSQDAFLCWLFENYNDCDVKNTTEGFINYFAKFNIDFNLSKIVKLKTYQQQNNIDVIVDFWINDENKNDNHYLMVIEDKTFSSAHSNQLDKYSKFILENKTYYKGIPRKNISFIYYKVDLRTDADYKDLNIDFGKLWNSYFIDDVYGFFKNKTHSKSEILSDYANHIVSLQGKIKNAPKLELINEWGLAEARAFFLRTLFPNLEQDNVKDNLYYETNVYHGTYLSFRVYYVIDNIKYRDIDGGEPNMENPIYFNKCYPLVEYQFRKNSEIVKIYTHITFKTYVGGKCPRIWTWKKSEYKKDLAFAENVTDKLKCLLKEANIATRKMSGKSAQSISVEDMLKENMTDSKSLLESFDKYIKIFKQLDSD